jgi:hypothetical protein
MLKILLALFAMSAAGYYGWNHIQKTPEATPQERIATIRSQASCTAKELGELAESEPKLLERELKGRMVSVSGVLSRGLAKGVASTDLILELVGSPEMKIDFHSDFHQFTRMGDGWKPGQFKFQKFGHEIVLVQSAPRGANRRNSAAEGESQKSTNIEPVVLFREGYQYTLKGIFQHVGKKHVRIQLRELP